MLDAILDEVLDTVLDAMLNAVVKIVQYGSVPCRAVVNRYERKEEIKMKILITTEWYAPVINGVVTSVLNLQRELEKLGHEVRILTLSGCGDSYTEGNVTYIGSIGAERVYPNARVAVSFSNEEIEEIKEEIKEEIEEIKEEVEEW